MATLLSKSIKDCIETRDKESVERLFDRIRSAVKEINRQGVTPLPYCYLAEVKKDDTATDPRLSQS